MLSKSPKYRRPLNQNQINILKLIFKFRFVTVPLLAEYLSKDKSSIYENLHILRSQGYIDKFYDSSFRLLGKSARYFLLTKAIKYLKDNTDFNEQTLRNMHKNKTVSYDHIEHCILIMKIAIEIDKQTNKEFNIITKQELAKLDWSIKPLPELYLTRKVKKENSNNNYFLELYDKLIPFYQIKRRIQGYQEDYEESDDWEDAQYPSLLLVLKFKATEKRLLDLLEDSYYDFGVRTTLIERMFISTINNFEKWKDPHSLGKDCYIDGI